MSETTTVIKFAGILISVFRLLKNLCVDNYINL